MGRDRYHSTRYHEPVRSSGFNLKPRSVPEILCMLADHIPSDLNFPLGGSTFICDCLTGMNRMRYWAPEVLHVDLRFRAQDWLVELGMPQGFTSFSEFPEGPVRQQARKDWLRDAAFYYEQGVRP